MSTTSSTRIYMWGKNAEDTGEVSILQGCDPASSGASPITELQV